MDEKVLELAEASQQAVVESNVALVRAKVKQRDPSFDGKCVECGEEVQPERIKFGADSCIECQTELERIQRSQR